MATLTTSGKLVLQAVHTATAPTPDLAVATGAQAVVEQVLNLALSSGTGAGKADLMFSDRREVTASSSEGLDLAGPTTDFTGATFSFVKVKLLFVKAAAGNTNNVIVGGAGANPWVGLFNDTGEATLRPGDVLLYVANSAAATGCPVVATTGDILKVANSGAGTSVTYDIVIIGTSA